MVRNSSWTFVALGLLACGGVSRTNGEEDAGTGGRAASGGTSGKGTGGTSGAGGTGATAATGAGATGGAGGSVASGGSGAVAAFGSGGTAPGSGGTGECGPGGCILGDPNAMPIEPPGPVLCGGVECAPGLQCCIQNGSCFDPVNDADACSQPLPDDDLWGRKPCSSNAHCPLNQFCMIDSGLCQGTGHCHPIDNCGGCGNGDPNSRDCTVCGCDGNEYLNQQTACMARANVVAATGVSCGETVSQGGGGAPGEDPVRTFTVCAVDDHCGAEESCCSLTGRCYPTDDPGQCATPPEGTRAPCTSDEQCYSHEYCAGDGCGTDGGCKSRGSSENCGVTLEPVCGCDGTSYTSAACADSRGVRVAASGACE